MSLRNEQCNKVCRILDDVLANRPNERDTLIMAIRKAFEALEKEPDLIWGLPVSADRPLADVEIIPRLRSIQMQVGGSYAIDRAIEIIEAVASTQPEIVRCKDCRWQKDQSGSTAWLPCRAIVTPSDFYCGMAERRTDD